MPGPYAEIQADIERRVGRVAAPRVARVIDRLLGDADRNALIDGEIEAVVREYVRNQAKAYLGIEDDTPSVVVEPSTPQAPTPTTNNILAYVGSLLTLEAFLASDAGAQVGNALPFQSANGDFLVVAALTDAAPRLGFLLPVAHTLVGVWQDGVNITADFTVDPANARRYVLNFDYGAGGATLLIRTRAVPSGTYQLLTLEAFRATDAGVQVGDARSFQSVNGDFLVVLELTDAAPRVGFLLPVGRTLGSVWQSSVDITADFDVDADNPRRYVLNFDYGAGGNTLLVRTNPSA